MLDCTDFCFPLFGRSLLHPLDEEKAAAFEKMSWNFAVRYKLLWMWFEPCTSSEREAQLKAYEMSNIALLCGQATRKYMAAVRRLQLHWRCNKVICFRQVVNHYSHAVYTRCCNQILEDWCLLPTLLSSDIGCLLIH